MARPRTASKVLELKGSFKTHPERKRAGEPEPTGVFDPEPPSHLTEGQARTWQEVVSITPAGVLTSADPVHVEIVACLLDEFREKKGRLETTKVTRLTSEMGKLGLNPSGRASLVVDKTKANKYADD